MLLCHLWENFRTSCFITLTDSEWRKEKLHNKFVTKSLGVESALMSSCEIRNGSVLHHLFLQAPFVLSKVTTSKMVIKIQLHLKVRTQCIHQPPVSGCDLSSLSCFFIFFICLSDKPSIPPKATSSGLQQTSPAPVSVTTAQGFAGREQRRGRHERQMKEHRQVSDICADSAPAAP